MNKREKIIFKKKMHKDSFLTEGLLGPISLPSFLKEMIS